MTYNFILIIRHHSMMVNVISLENVRCLPVLGHGPNSSKSKAELLQLISLFRKKLPLT